MFKTLRVSNINSNYYDNTDERYTTSNDLTLRAQRRSPRTAGAAGPPSAEEFAPTIAGDHACRPSSWAWVKDYPRATNPGEMATDPSSAHLVPVQGDVDELDVLRIPPGAS